MITYIGIQTGMSDRNAHIGSVIAEFQLFISSVASLSACSSVCQIVLILQDYLVVVTWEQDYRGLLIFYFAVQCIPQQILQFLDSLLGE